MRPCLNFKVIVLSMFTISRKTTSAPFALLHLNLKTRERESRCQFCPGHILEGHWTPPDHGIKSLNPFVDFQTFLHFCRPFCNFFKPCCIHILLASTLHYFMTNGPKGVSYYILDGFHDTYAIQYLQIIVIIVEQVSVPRLPPSEQESALT